MNKPNIVKITLGVLSTPLIFGAPLFLAAGTFKFWQAWIFITVFTVGVALHTAYLVRYDPALLERRMRVGPTAEKRPVQRIIVALVLASFFLLLVVAGLDYRFGWSTLPVIVVIVGDLLVALSWIMFYVVIRENSFASATIEISQGQQLVSTGPYALVRHPMYSGAMVLMVGMALALGSLWSLVVVLAAAPALHWRIVDEEQFLRQNLDGYDEYCKNVRYRLLPGIY